MIDSEKIKSLSEVAMLANHIPSRQNIIFYRFLSPFNVYFSADLLDFHISKVAGLLPQPYLTKMCINKKRPFRRIDQGRAGVFMFFHNFVNSQFCFIFSVNKFVQQKMARVKRFIFSAGKVLSLYIFVV